MSTVSASCPESQRLSLPHRPAPSAGGPGALQTGGSTGVSFCWCSGEELEACLSIPTTLSHAGMARSRVGFWERELCCFASRPLGIVYPGLKGCSEVKRSFLYENQVLVYLRVKLPLKWRG